MAVRVVGAGLGRTGTNSLRLALEQLLGAPCYHMMVVSDRPQDVDVWWAAVRGEMPDWSTFPAGFGALVDWPSTAFWRELAAAHPDALVLLSVRESAEAWWRSVERTLVPTMTAPVPADRPGLARQRQMVRELVASTFTPDLAHGETAMAAYERHNAEVRASVPPHRLLEWQAGDGWQPICDALGLPVPSQPFPHSNTTADFRSMVGLDGEGAT
jgi:hypothetical protein